MSGEPRALVTGGSAAYLLRVSLTRLIRFLTILALVVSSPAMFGAAPASAAAHHAAMAADGHQMAGHDMAGDASMSHCQDTDGTTKDQPCESSDCLTACAAVPAIPALGGDLEPHALAHGLRQLPALVSVPHGLVPEAATPPPRGFLTI